MNDLILPNRSLLRVSGADRVKFLQGLVTNDVKSENSWGAFLTPQGRIKYLAFFYNRPDGIWIDCHSADAQIISKFLNFHKLRAQVAVEPMEGLNVATAIAESYETEIEEFCRKEGILCVQDPRTSKALRFVGKDLTRLLSSFDFKPLSETVFDVPQCARFNLLAYEANLDLLNGVSWDKGCYIGQEVTARIHYRHLEKKRLMKIRFFVDETAEALENALIKKDDKEIGEIKNVAFKDGRWTGFALMRKEFWDKTEKLSVAIGERAGITLELYEIVRG